MPLGLYAQQEDGKRVILVSSTSPIPSDDDKTFMTTTVDVVNRHSEFRGLEAVQQGQEPKEGNFLETFGNLEPEFVIVGDRAPGANGQTIFTCILMNLSTGNTVATQQLFYTIVGRDAVYELQDIVEKMLALIPPVPHYPPFDNLEWKTAWFYPYLMAGASYRWYFFDNHMFSGTITYEVTVGADVQFFSFKDYGLAVGFETSFTNDSISVLHPNENNPEYYPVSSANAMLFLKASYCPREFFFSGYAGAYMLAPFETNIKSNMGYLIGFDGGVKAGMGILSLCIRYFYDFNKFELPQLSGNPYQRQGMTLGLSYKLGVFHRAQKTVMELEQ